MNNFRYSDEFKSANLSRKNIRGSKISRRQKLWIFTKVIFPILLFLGLQDPSFAQVCNMRFYATMTSDTESIIDTMPTYNAISAKLAAKGYYGPLSWDRDYQTTRMDWHYTLSWSRWVDNKGMEYKTTDASCVRVTRHNWKLSGGDPGNTIYTGCEEVLGLYPYGSIHDGWTFSDAFRRESNIYSVRDWVVSVNIPITGSTDLSGCATPWPDIDSAAQGRVGGGTPVPAPLATSKARAGSPGMCLYSSDTGGCTSGGDIGKEKPIMVAGGGRLGGDAEPQRKKEKKDNEEDQSASDPAVVTGAY